MKKMKLRLVSVSFLLLAYAPFGASAQMVLDARNNVVLSSSVLNVAVDLQGKLDKNLRDLWGQINAIQRGCNLTPLSSSGSVSTAPSGQSGLAMQMRLAQIMAELQSNVNELQRICPQLAPFSALDFSQVPPALPTPTPTPTPAPTTSVAPTEPAPTTSISTITMSNLSANNVTIRWTTDESRGGVVYYSTSSPVNMETSPAVTDINFGKEH